MFQTIMYPDLIKLCNKYNIEYKTYYGKNKTAKSLKRKIEQHVAKMKKRKAEVCGTKSPPLKWAAPVNTYVSPLELDELGTLIRYYIGD